MNNIKRRSVVLQLRAKKGWQNHLLLFWPASLCFEEVALVVCHFGDARAGLPEHRCRLPLPLRSASAVVQCAGARQEEENIRRTCAQALKYAV